MVKDCNGTGWQHMIFLNSLSMIKYYEPLLPVKITALLIKNIV